MEERYSKSINNLKQLLNRFRFKLLLFDLLKGGIAGILFVLFYLFGYYLFISLSPLTVSFKTTLFFVFIFVLLLLSVYFVRCIYLFFSSLNLKNDRLLKRIQHFPGIVNDVFISLYYLAFHKERVSGNEILKDAAFVQKYATLQDENRLLVFPVRNFLKPSLFLSFLLALLFINGGFFGGLYKDLINYEDVSNPRFNIEFTLLNESLDVENGKPFQLKMQVYSEYMDIENVFLAFGGGQFLMDRQDSVFVYDFDVINNDLRFNFIADGIESKLYKIRVLPTPEITDYQVVYSPPAYAGIKSETFKNTVDFRVLYGSFLKFTVNFSELDTLFLKRGEELSLLPLKSGSYTDFMQKVVGSGEVVLLGSNAHFVRKELIHFNITAIPDLYPGIQVSQIQDSLNSGQYYFYGIISDDYGFSDLRFVYSLNGKNNTIMPINITKHLTAQEFYFEFNFGEFAGMDKTEIKYYFEVFDNDVISGPKSTRSDAEEYQIPDLNSIFEHNVEVNSSISASLKEAEKLAKEVVEGVKELQMKILENASDDWEKQQLAKEIVEKKEKLDKLLKEVQDENMKKASLNRNFTEQDSLLMAKQQMMNELLDKVLNDELKQLMDEFKKLAEEFSKDKFNDLDEKMRLEYDQLSEVLDRNIDLLQRMHVEEQHRMLSQQIDQLRKKQEEFRKSMDDLSDNKEKGNKDGENDGNNEDSENTLSEKSKELKEELENVMKNYEELKEENQNLSLPFEFDDMKDRFDRLSGDMEKQHDNAEKGESDKGLSDDIQEQLDELAEEMEKQQQQNFMEMDLPQSDIELIIQNILLVSFAQEELLQEYRTSSPKSAGYSDLGGKQELRRQEYKIIKDSLALLSKSNIMLASLLDDKFYLIETKFDLLPDYIQDNKKNDLLKEQQYIITYLNDMALILSDALEKGKGEGDDEGDDEGEGGTGGKKGGKKKGKGKSKGDGEQYDNLKDIQQRMKEGMENLLNEIKNGEKGKPFQQNISKMIRESELFMKSLEEFMQENGALSETERQMLNDINKLLNDNIKDLSNYSLGRKLIERNNLMYNKLLISEKAAKEREEYEEKRRAVSAGDSNYKRPEVMLNLKEKNSLMRSDLQRSGLILNPYYKNIFNNYFIKLGDE